MRNGHDIPLETFGGMHRQDLHPLLGDLDATGLEALLDGLRGLEEGQQSGQISAATVGVAGDVLGKGVEVFAAGDGPAHAPRPDLGLHTDADRVLHVGDQFG